MLFKCKGTIILWILNRYPLKITSNSHHLTIITQRPEHCFNTIFAFLSLNTASWAREEIFGAKFLSFGRAGVIMLIVSVLYMMMSVVLRWCGGEVLRWVKKLHFIPNVLLLLSIRTTFAMQLGYSWLANVVLLQCKEAPFEGLKSHRRCQTL